MMRPGLHTRGVMRLARIKTNKQKNDTLPFYILTFPNTDIQHFGFSRHWNCAHTVETPSNDHSKFEKLVAAYGKWLLMRVEQQGVVYKAFLEGLSFLGVRLRRDFGGGL